MVLLTQQMAVVGTVWKFVPPNVRQDPVLSLRGCMQVLMGEPRTGGGQGTHLVHLWFG